MRRRGEHMPPRRRFNHHNEAKEIVVSILKEEATAWNEGATAWLIRETEKLIEKNISLVLEDRKQRISRARETPSLS